MPLDVYYEGHSWLAVSYKRAHEIKREQDNFDKFLMAAYIYDLVGRCAPIFNPFVKDKVKPWLEKPYELVKASDRGRNNTHGDKGSKGGGIAFMEAYMARHNAAMANKAMGDANPDQRK